MGTVTIPTPKTPTRQTLGRDDRLRIHTLYYDAGWSIDQIVLQLNVTRRQVQWALETRLTPQKQRCGRKPALNTPQRKALVEWVTKNSTTRRISWFEIPIELSLNLGEKSIRNAFKREGYVRAFARRKIILTEENKHIRLQWAEEHLNWTLEQWDSILWTDETWVQPGIHKRQRITRLKGPSEVYHPDCVEKRVQRKIGWMFWGGDKWCLWERNWAFLGEELGHNYSRVVF